MKIGLQARFALSLTLLIAIFSLIVAGVFLMKTRTVHQEMLDASKAVSSDTLLREAKNQNEALVQLIAEQLVNPLYFNELETVTNFATSVLDQEGVVYIYVFDPSGRIIHDGTESLEAFGQVLNDAEFHQVIEERRLVSISQGPILHTTVPVMAGSKLLGGVRVGISLAAIREAAQEIEGKLTEISKRSSDGLANSTLLLIAVTALAGVLIGLLIFGGVVKTILTLRDVMRDIGHGHYEAGFVGVPIKRSDELGDLVSSVEEMTRNLASSEAKLREALAMAHSANQAKSTFLSAMSHELLTPLNAIMGFAQLLEKGTHQPGDEKQAQFVRQILDGGDVLQGMIHQVLDYTVLETGERKLKYNRTSAEDLVTAAFASVQKRADRTGVRLMTDYGRDDLPDLITDRRCLEQILTNLLTNAIKFNADGGWIRVSVESVDRAGLPGLRFMVEDNGDGIAEVHHDELFAPFNRLGRERMAISGSGLGLSIAIKLVDLLGGELDFDSEEGRGSRFWVDLPLAPDTDAA